MPEGLDRLGKRLGRQAYFDRAHALFENPKRRFLKFEFLDSYDEPRERAPRELFERGALDSAELLRSGYQRYVDWLARMRRQGVSCTRVHVATTPLSSYLQFEKMYYSLAMRAGERISLLDRAKFRQAVQPRYRVPMVDFIVVDDSVVLTLYADRGQLDGGEVVGGIDIEDERARSDYIQLFEDAFSVAAPLDET